MEKGYSDSTHLIIKCLQEETKQEIEKLLKSNIKPIDKKDFTEEIEQFENSVSLDDLQIMKSYTGFDFKWINAILRNNWNYEEHGLKTEEKVRKWQTIGEKISSLIDMFPSTQESFMTYRGTTIREFYQYGIHTLEELNALKGKYLYEKAFTSTSLEEDNSYFGKEIRGEIPNIEVKYIIPSNSQDGIPLLSSDLNYYLPRKEYVLNKDALSKVLDVEVKENTAHISVLLIPKRIWNKPDLTEKEDLNAKTR